MRIKFEKYMIKFSKCTDSELIDLIRRGEKAADGAADSNINDTGMENIISQADEACAELMKRYAPLINSAVCDALAKISANTHKSGELHGMQLSRADEDELRQEAAIKLYRAAVTYRDGEVSFGLYAKICIRRRMSAIVRQKCGEELLTASIDDEAENDSVFVSDADPSSEIIDREREAELDRTIKESMSELEYSVYKLCLEGADSAAIVNRLGISEKSAGNALYRMRQKLKRIIKTDIN